MHVITSEAEATESELATFERELVPVLRPAYRLAIGMLLDRTLAEYAVQDASLRAWDRRRKRIAGTDMRPWFLAIVANRCRDIRRRGRDGVPLSATIVDASLPAPDDSATSIDLRRALRTLSLKQRLAVVLRFYLDLPYDDVAAVLGCSANAAKLRVSRAAEALRETLQDFEERR